MRCCDDLRVQQIIELLNERLQRDFTGYKSATLIRRIQRRISAVQSVGLNEYLAFLTSSDSEAELLANDLLISVTAFFRDKEAYKALEATLGNQYGSRRRVSHLGYRLCDR